MHVMDHKTLEQRCQTQKLSRSNYTLHYSLSRANYALGVFGYVFSNSTYALVLTIFSNITKLIQQLKLKNLIISRDLFETIFLKVPRNFNILASTSSKERKN